MRIYLIRYTVVIKSVSGWMVAHIQAESPGRAQIDARRLPGCDSSSEIAAVFDGFIDSLDVEQR